MHKVVPNQAAGHDRALQVAYNFVSTFLAVCLQFVEDLELIEIPASAPRTGPSLCAMVM